jgi:cyclomaltodextrinase / maltogenic alpha-amylase / neopullulanase
MNSLVEPTPLNPQPSPFSADETVMEDFLFGGIEADEQQRLAQERQRWTGMRHFHQIDPLDPQPGDPVTVTVSVGPDVQVDRITLYFTVDGSDPAGRRGAAANGMAVPLQPVSIRWENLIWDYVAVWQGQLPPQLDSTLVFYRIEGWCSYDERISLWSREANLDRTAERPVRYGYHVDTFTTPAWAREAVVYQIFVDRFASGEIENTGYGILDAGCGIQRLARRWLEPGEMNGFAGGNLRGVLERLDYIAGLGVTAIWLSPLFRTPSYHGYDTTDFYTVEPRFGTNEDLHSLVKAAHERNLRVILDFVANHTSTEFAPFVEAQRDGASPYRAWFDYDSAYPHGYRCFFDVATMPQLNTNHPEVRRYLIDAACHWLVEYEVDGFRLDYAAGPSHAFWSEFSAACRQVKPDCWLFGEVTLAGDALRTYTGRLDGCLDFALCRLLRQLCAGPEPSITLTQFVNAVERSRLFFGDFLLPSFLDNHDMNRFLWVAGDDPQRLRLAAGLMFALGGPPILYYGTEVGLSQPRPKGPWREEARHPMRWGEDQDPELFAFFKRWIAARRRHPALCQGALWTLWLDEAQGIWLGERRTEADRVLIAVNVSDEPRTVALPPGTYSLLAGTTVGAAIELPARQVDLLTPVG